MTKTAIDVTKKIEELENEIERLRIYETFRKKLVDEMQWNYMDWHDADDQHTETWFTEPEDESYKYKSYKAAKDIIDKLDNIMSK